MQIIISGNPVSKHRPRFTRGQKRPYSDQKGITEFYRGVIRGQVKKPLTGAINLVITFFMPRPQGHYKKSGELRASAPAFHVVKPDLDNLVKFILDAMNGIVYQDDKQIIYISATKVYAKIGQELCTVVMVENI